MWVACGKAACKGRAVISNEVRNLFTGTQASSRDN